MGAFTAFGLYLATTYRGPVKGKNEVSPKYKEIMDKRLGMDTKGMQKDVKDAKEKTKNVVDSTVNKIEKSAEKTADAIKKTITGK